MYRAAAVPSSAVAIDELAPRRWWHFGERALREFLGERARVEPRGYASLDGARRVRFVDGDPRARFEEIDVAHQLTLRSQRACARVAPPELGSPDRASRAPRAVWHAPVIGRPRRVVCFSGRAGRAAPEPRMVRLVVHDDGVLVVRVAADGRDAGDTWHPRFEHALHQLDRELGTHLGALRAGDRVRPWSRQNPWGRSSPSARL